MWTKDKQTRKMGGRGGGHQMMDLFKNRPKIVVINQSLNPVITRRIIMMDILVYKDILILKC